VGEAGERQQSAQWLQAAQSGDQLAVDRLLERHLPGLRAFVRLRAGPLVRARESVSDLVQSVCLEVLQHADRFQFGGEAGFKHWLYTTALRRILNRHDYWTTQRRDVHRERPLQAGRDDGSAASLALCYRRFSSPSQKAMGREQLQRMEEAFDRLAEADREIITLSRLAGLNGAALAEALGRSEGASRVALHRALARLAALLDETP